MNEIQNVLNMKKEDVMNRISSSQLKNYGIYQENLNELLIKAREESEEAECEFVVVAALNNADTTGAFIPLLKKEIDLIFYGMKIVGYGMDSAKLILYIPQSEEAFAKEIESKAKEEGIEIVTGIVNRRAHEGSAFVHIITMIFLAELFENTYKPGVYVSVNGKEVKKVDCFTKVKELCDVSEAKALELGFQMHSPEDAELTVEEAGITNGILNVLTSKDCIVAETEKRLMASRNNSCGKCVFCREGLNQLQNMQKDIADGKGKMEYYDLTDEIGSAMCDSTPCSLGQKSAEIAMSSMKNFKSEYDAHIKRKNCIANVCTSFMAIYIDPMVCTGCGECQDECPKDCIDGKSGYIHMIDDFDCTKCGKCISACEENAIIKTTGKLPKLPSRLMKVGKFKKR